MFAVVMASLYAVLHGVLRTQQKAYAAIEEQVPRRFIVSVMSRDLAGIVSPSGVLAGPTIAERLEDGGYRVDRLELHSANARIGQENPWGDVQKVKYFLLPPEAGDRTGAYDLMRAVTRNLLWDEEDVQEECLARNVRSLEIGCYDGEEWQDSWDSTARANELPRAFRIHIGFTSDEENRSPDPDILMFVLVLISTEPTEQ